MKVLFDHQIFNAQKFGGISRYFFELLSALREDKEVKSDVALLYTDNEYIQSDKYYAEKILLIPEQKPLIKANSKFPGSKLLARVEKKIFPKPVTTGEQNKVNTIAKLKEGNFDIFHPTYYDTYFLDHLNGKPYVLTVYDLIHEVFPEFLMFHLNKSSLMLQTASKIIAISENTKKDLVSIYDVAEEKVEVIHLASSFTINDGNLDLPFKNKLPDKYLLFVGSRIQYKNFYFFARIFQIISKDFSDLYIVCTGSEFNKQEQTYFQNLGINNKVVHIFTSDNELAFLYQQAVAFIFPSQYEGFGLPLLEAFACGCPVLCSDGSSLREIAEDAAIYFEPKNPASMLKAIRSILSDASLRKIIIEKGYKQLNKFSWQFTVNSTKHLYKSIIN